MRLRLLSARCVRGVRCVLARQSSAGSGSGSGAGEARRLVVEDDEVSAADVEAVEVLAGVLRVVDVLEDHERGAASVLRVAPAHSTQRTPHNNSF